MAFDGKEGEYVSLDDAARWTANFRTENPEAIKAHFYGKTKLNKILTQLGCKGLRIYNAIDDAGNYTFVVVGAKLNEDDQLGSAHKIVEMSHPCPPNCGRNNALNS